MPHFVVPVPGCQGKAYVKANKTTMFHLKLSQENNYHLPIRDVQVFFLFFFFKDGFQSK